MADTSWQDKTLDDCVRLLSGGTPSKQRSEYWEGDIPWVSPKSVKGDRIHDTQDHVTSEAVSSRTRLVPSGTILMVVRSMVLAKELPVALTTRSVTFNQDIKAILCEPDLDTRFLFYWLLANSYEILGIVDEAAHGTKRIQTDRFLGLPIGVPPLAIQHKIVSMISAYDDLIENNRRRIEILGEMAQLLCHEWFAEFRFPGYEKAKMVDSPLGEIPGGWRVQTLQEVCNRITDGSHWSPRAATEGYPMASVKDMHDWGFNIDTCKTIGEQDYQKLCRDDCKPLKNDVLIAKDGSYLKHTFVVEEESDLVILSSIAILRPSGILRPHLLAMYLRDPIVKARMKGYVSGVAVPRIVLKDFRKFTVMVPPESVQNEWGETVEPMIRLCWRLVDENINLRHTRDLLLPKLITGELDVSGPAIDSEVSEA